MNKWMVRFWGLLALLSLVMLVVTTAWPASPQPHAPGPEHPAALPVRGE